MNRNRFWMVTAALAVLFTNGVFFGGAMSFAHAQTQPISEPFFFDKPAVTQHQFDLFQNFLKPKKGQLGSYYTGMDPTNVNRVANIKRAVDKIDNVVIQPGGKFSYNDTVGNANLPEDGWLTAGVIMNGALSEGYGGGICQVSSTLFNAVDQAGLTVVERHSHSLPTKYVPAGRDATVAYGTLDFVFSNSFDYPVKIKAKVYDDSYVLVRILKA
ncbi:UNVERIFIED_CONTAM: vancomycin resistance protein VanW [Brevibacillus sp. OAP136]